MNEEQEIQNQNPSLIQPKELPNFCRKVYSENQPWPSSPEVPDVFDIIRYLPDPEHPFSLEQLQVVEMDLINIDQQRKIVTVHFTPTIPNCSSANLIGLMIKVRLIRWLPREYKKDVFITKGSHMHEQELNQQLNDKERIYAAMEQPQIQRHLS